MIQILRPAPALAPVVHSRLRAFHALTKPRVVSLIVFTALIGMLLAAPGLPLLSVVVAGTVGIALVASGAAAVNCLLERSIDAVMARTQRRPLVKGVVTPLEAMLFATSLCVSGLALLGWFVNPLTMWLTLATFVGYAIIYTLVLKPRTPQSIVIGGAAGAMPPVLGWTSVTGHLGVEALLLFLIIFAWTPPHFWSLALYRVEDYARAGVPMLPVTHGRKRTLREVLVYTLILCAVSLLPWIVDRTSWFYLVAAVVLGSVFLGYALRLFLAYSDRVARATFRYSITYLASLFAALLVDHYLRSTIVL